MNLWAKRHIFRIKYANPDEIQTSYGFFAVFRGTAADFRCFLLEEKISKKFRWGLYKPAEIVYNK